MAPELPVIYENPRFDAATPTFWPVINRAIIFGAVLGVEWGSLTLIDEAPRYLKFATFGIAVLILAVHESWPWLRMRDKRLYPASMAALIVAYVAIFAYASIAEPAKPHAVPSALEPASLPNANALPFVSPIHEKSQKWDFASGIRSSIIRSGLSADCHVTIVRLQVPFAEDSAADFKEILNVIGWKFDEKFAASTIDRDITVRAIYDAQPGAASKPGPSRACAEALSARLRNVAKRRSGSTINAPERWLSEAEAPEYLKGCLWGCVEVDFGNEGN
jgi:hypothetical protein